MTVTAWAWAFAKALELIEPELTSALEQHGAQARRSALVNHPACGALPGPSGGSEERRTRSVPNHGGASSTQVLEDSTGNVKIKCPNAGKDFAAEEISAQASPWAVMGFGAGGGCWCGGIWRAPLGRRALHSGGHPGCGGSAFAQGLCARGSRAVLALGAFGSRPFAFAAASAGWLRGAVYAPI